MHREAALASYAAPPSEPAGTFYEADAAFEAALDRIDAEAEQEQAQGSS